jgi:hypothetical protein
MAIPGQLGSQPAWRLVIRLVAPRAGTSVLAKAFYEPWLTAGDVLDGDLARLKTGAQ